MRRYLLDTNMMGDFIDQRRGIDVRVDEMRRRGDRIVTCLPVVAELFAGVEGSQSQEILLKVLDAYNAWAGRSATIGLATI